MRRGELPCLKYVWPSSSNWQCSTEIILEVEGLLIDSPPKHGFSSNVCPIRTPRTHKISSFSPTPSIFATGSPLLIRGTFHLRKRACEATPFSIKCEQSTQKGNSLDVWLGRLAMVGFAVAITVEICSGKGLLENFGLTTPLPTVALVVTALVGVLAAKS